MANFHNHPRIRRRNYEYPRLMPSDIKKYMSLPNGFGHPLSWSINDQLVLELGAITTPYGLDLKGVSAANPNILDEAEKRIPPMVVVSRVSQSV